MYVWGQNWSFDMGRLVDGTRRFATEWLLSDHVFETYASLGTVSYMWNDINISLSGYSKLLDENYCSI